MKKTTDEWQEYRSKFLTRAKRLTAPLKFVDALGQEQRGKRGDYLVEHGSGLQRIWPRLLFENAHIRIKNDNDNENDNRNGNNHNEDTNREPRPGQRKKSAFASTLNTARKGPESCGKTQVSGRIPAVNCLRYNM